MSTSVIYSNEIEMLIYMQPDGGFFLLIGMKMACICLFLLIKFAFWNGKKGPFGSFFIDFLLNICYCRTTMKPFQNEALNFLVFIVLCVGFCTI